MDNTEFRRMVAAYEHSSRHDPRRFALVTAAYAAFGYASILVALVLAVVALKWGVGRLFVGRFNVGLLFLLIGCASLLWSLLGALWARQQPPEGVAITRNEAPRLFELIDKVRRKSGAPAPDVVLLDGDLNAAIVQQPRLGLLGWHRNTLILGLPMLMALSVKQVAAVIAHEFGHLRGAHGKLGAWVYRTRRSWWVLAESRERARLGATWADLALAVFFKHFFPRFNARAFVLSRQQEYEADRVAHKAVGAQHAADGLIGMSVQARYLHERFWPAVYATASKTATPQVQPYRLMRKRIRDALAQRSAAAWLRDELKRLPSDTDTHPSLRDRLAFAEVKPALPAAPEVSAAEALLRDSYRSWIERFDARWKEQVGEQWSELHRRRRGLAELMQELQAERGGPVKLSADDYLLWARAAREVAGPKAEEAVLRNMLLDHPGHIQGRFELGVTLSDAESMLIQDEGAALLGELAREPAHMFSATAARRHESWLEERERFAELKPWRERVRELEGQAEQAWEALHDFDGAQRFEPQPFGKRVLRPLLDMLRREPGVGRAFLVMKTASAAPGWRFAVLVVERSGALLGQPDKMSWWETLREQAQLPCPFMVIDLAHPFWSDKDRAPLVRQMLEVRDACIYVGSKG
jgi:Zn-dependent protease with chaperone function